MSQPGLAPELADGRRPGEGLAVVVVFRLLKDCYTAVRPDNPFVLKNAIKNSTPSSASGTPVAV
jgi:hypothetical protein